MYNNFIIFGSTGGTGIQFVNHLLDQGKNVTIVVRDITKAKTIFKDNYEKINLVIEAELGNGSALKNEEIKKALKNSDCLISALGSRIGSNPKICEYVSIRELIELAEEAKIKKCVLVSSLFITRPWGFLPILLNNLIPFALGWKALAENKLRLSKLNYMIIRPGALKDKEENETSVGVFQGDKVKGKITRSNLAKGILLALNDPEFNKDKITLDMVAVPKGEKFLISGENQKMQEDNKSSIVTADHFNAVKRVNMILTIILFVGLIYLINRYKQ